MPAASPPEPRNSHPLWQITAPVGIGDAVITTDTLGRVTSLNPVAESLTGWKLAEAASLPLESIFKIVDPKTRSTIESPTVRALREGVNVGLAIQTLLIAKDGKEYPIGPIEQSATPIRNDLGELTGASLVFRDITNINLHERQIRAALAYSDSIIETLREPFLVLDHSFRVKTANHAFYKAFQVEKEQTEGYLIFELAKGQWDVSQLRTLLNDVLSDSDPIHDFHMEIDFPTIGNKSLLLNARRFGLVLGQPDLILLAIEDITLRRQAETILRDSEQRQRFVLDSIPQKIATTTPEGAVDYFNPQWMEFTGLSFEQIKNWGWQQFIHPDDVAGHVQAWRHSLATGMPFELESRFRRADGEYRWHTSRAVPLRDEAGRIVMWVASNTDVHDIMLAERALVDSEIRYRRLFETAKDGILLLDTLTGRITDANPFMSELLGYPHAQFLGKEMWEIGLFSDKAANEKAVRTLQESGYIRYDHLPLETNRGLLVEVEVVANSYHEDHQKVIQCNIRDITQRSHLERQAQEQAAALAELHRRKDEFLAMLSHELRNPLAPITNALQLLGMQPDEGAPQRQARTIIERQVGQLTRLVDDLLEVSRITTGRIHLHPQRVALHSIVERALESARPLIDQHQHKLSVSLPPTPIWISADAARLEQVIVNLLTNAAKYTLDGGQIALTVRQERNEAVLQVKDTGVGIAPELLPHIFELFTQAERSLDRSQGGLGIGLCLVQRLVEMHGGHVEVTSVLGAGSEFNVFLPILETSQAAAPTSTPAIPDPSSPQLRVLVVDDNVDAAQTLALLMQALRHEVRTAYDGPSALAAASDFQPHVVLLDIGLPGIDGYEVARRMRQQTYLTPAVLVAMTGYGQESDRRRSQAAGFDHHLVKPANFTKLQEILANVAEQAS